jgi:CBS domain-containing protein
MTEVSDLLDVKGRSVWTISPQQPVHDALQIMAEKKIGALVAISDGEIVGIFSERDFARKSIAVQPFSMETPVGELMTSPVYYVLPGQSVEDCMRLMTEKRFRHLPVMDEDMLIGIVSIGDVVNNLMKEKNAAIHDLESYIHKNEE